MNERTIAVFTGSRAEYGLLRPILEALEASEGVVPRLVVGGSHLVGTEPTILEIQEEREIHAVVEMQGDQARTRLSDARAVARGIRGISEALALLEPDYLLVLGDRVEVLAAATSASLMGIRVAHVHGGDAASGVSDESIRHAVTKLSHIHFPATPASASRILAMGEHDQSVFVVGSPAIDGLDRMPDLPDAEWDRLGRPRFVILHHPVGDPDEVEEHRMGELVSTVGSIGSTLVFAPNLDPGSDGIRAAIGRSGCNVINHLGREDFIGLLRRTDLLIGNSSAGLIECAALGRPAIDIGDRQAGRERPDTVVHLQALTGPGLEVAIEQGLGLLQSGADSRYGTGVCGARIAEILGTIPPGTIPIRKCWSEPRSG